MFIQYYLTPCPLWLMHYMHIVFYISFSPTGRVYTVICLSDIKFLASAWSLIVCLTSAYRHIILLSNTISKVIYNIQHISLWRLTRFEIKLKVSLVYFKYDYIFNYIDISSLLCLYN